jgi:hypothetical protein
MRTLGGLCIALLLAGGLFAQRGNYVNSQPVLTGGFGNVVYPGGTPATVPGMTRSFGNVVYPGGGGPRLVVPGSHQAVRPQRAVSPGLVYSYPLYVGGYGYGYGYNGTDAPVDPSQQQQQPNVTVVYPPQPAPVIINQYGSGDSSPAVRPHMYDMPAEPQADSTPAEAESTHYLIAFKDHTIYSAVAYWVDGDTLHYFTAGNTHNQASLSLVDRELTLRLNQESGVSMKLPAAKQ